MSEPSSSLPPEPPAAPPRRSRWVRLLEALPTEFEPRSYPNSGFLAVTARVLFLIAVTAVVLAAVGPHHIKPRIVGHYHLQRFAAWYLLSALAAAALPHLRLRWLGLGLIAFVLSAETIRALPLPLFEGLRQNVSADIGGIFAFLFPLAVARWRRAVGPRIPRKP